MPTRNRDLNRDRRATRAKSVDRPRRRRVHGRHRARAANSRRRVGSHHHDGQRRPPDRRRRSAQLRSTTEASCTPSRGSLGSLRSAVQRGPIGTGLEPSPRAALHIYQLALAVRLWSQPHYRRARSGRTCARTCATWRFRHGRRALGAQPLARRRRRLLLFAYPLIAAVAAVVRVRHGDAPDGWAAAFAEQLLEPDDWFFKWRLNCVLASYHALVTNEPGYAMEDKLTFSRRRRRRASRRRRGSSCRPS